MEEETFEGHQAHGVTQPPEKNKLIGKIFFLGAALPYTGTQSQTEGKEKKVTAELMQNLPSWTITKTIE